MASCLEGFEVPQQMLVEFGVILCVFFKIRIVVLDLGHGFGIYNSGKCISYVLLFEISRQLSPPRTVLVAAESGL